MKKRLIAAVLILCLVPLGIREAHADLIYEPLHDDFYESHASDCVYEDRYYTVVMPGEGAAGVQSPEDLRETMRFPGRSELYISYVYEAPDGTRYGLYEELFSEEGELLPEEEQKSCWLPMDALFESYTGEMFQEEYSRKIRDLAWSFPKEELEKLENRTISFYAYPGGDAIREIRLTRRWIVSLRLEGEDLFTDPYNNTWACLGFRQVRPGKKEIVWILLDDPVKSPNLVYAKGHFRPDTRKWPDLKYLPTSVNRWVYVTLWIGIPLAVTAAAAVLIFVIIRKHRKKNKNGG